MASTPGHPFWLFLAGIIERQAHRSMEQRLAQFIKPLPAELATGPIVLKQVRQTILLAPSLSSLYIDLLFYKE